MENYSVPYFGEIDAKNLKAYYSTFIKVNKKKLQLDLNFENRFIETLRLDILKDFISNISDLDIKNQKYIESDYTNEECDTVKTYILHHLEELDRKELSTLIDFTSKSISPEIQLMNSLRLVRVGLYPEIESAFAIFDYSIGQDLTQYLIAIHVDENGKFSHMVMES